MTVYVPFFSPLNEYTPDALAVVVAEEAPLSLTVEPAPPVPVTVPLIV